MVFMFGQLGMCHQLELVRGNLRAIIEFSSNGQDAKPPLAGRSAIAFAKFKRIINQTATTGIFSTLQFFYRYLLEG